MQGVYYRIFDKNIPSETITEGIVSNTNGTIYPGQECCGSPYDLPNECELHHFKSRDAAIEYCNFSILREELERFFIK